MRFASPIVALNSLEKKLAKRTSVHCADVSYVLIFGMVKVLAPSFSPAMFTRVFFYRIFLLMRYQMVLFAKKWPTLKDPRSSKLPRMISAMEVFSYGLEE